MRRLLGWSYVALGLAWLFWILAAREIAPAPVSASIVQGAWATGLIAIGLYFGAGTRVHRFALPFGFLFLIANVIVLARPIVGFFQP